ncbi:MAG: hypothetical protein ACRC30_07240 [Clostridium sp.]
MFFKKKVTSKSVIKDAEKFFEYLMLLKGITDKEYPILDEEDREKRGLLLEKIEKLIDALKTETKEYLNTEMTSDEFDKILKELKSNYNYLRVRDPVFRAIIYGYLTPVQGGNLSGTPVDGGDSFSYLYDMLKNPDEE